MWFRKRKQRYCLHLSYTFKEGSLYLGRNVIHEEIQVATLSEAKALCLARVKRAIEDGSLQTDLGFHASIEPWKRILGVETGYPRKAWKIKRELSTGNGIMQIFDPEQAFILLYEERGPLTYERDGAKITEIPVLNNPGVQKYLDNPILAITDPPKFPELKNPDQQ